MTKKIGILGQGIAGTVLGFSLRQAGYDVVWIDQYGLSKASYVASGLYNPIVLKRMQLVSHGLEMVAELESFYPALEEFCQTTFFYPRKIYRVFHSEGERNDWSVKQSNLHWKDLLGDIENLPSPIQANFQGGIVHKTGWVDTKLLLQSFRAKIAVEGALIETHFNADELRFTDNKVQWKDCEFDAFVFAEGWLASANNPFYPPAVFRPSKGELLEIELPKALNTQKIIHFSHFLIPLNEEKKYRLGATYDHQKFDHQCTESAKEELLQSFEKISSGAEPKIISQYAGVRATTKDRKALIGFHPIKEKLGFFNGMGSRAILMAPFLAKKWIKAYEGENEIPKIFDIQRFF